MGDNQVNNWGDNWKDVNENNFCLFKRMKKTRMTNLRLFKKRQNEKEGGVTSFFLHKSEKPSNIGS